MKRYFGKWLGCNFAIAVIFVSLQIFKVYLTLKDTERFCKMYTFICKANTLRCKIYTLKCKKYALKCKIYTLICAMYTLICKNPRNLPPLLDPLMWLPTQEDEEQIVVRKAHSSAGR